MENKSYLENILTLIKSLCMLYINGCIESSNEKVRAVMESGLKTSLELQDNLYQLMKANNMYNVSNVKDSVIKTTYKNLFEGN